MTAREVRRIDTHISHFLRGDITSINRAERHLIRYGARAYEALTKACLHPHYRVRLYAVWILAAIRHPDAFDTIVKHCYDLHTDVRYDSRVALGKYGNSLAIPIFADIIESEDADWHSAVFGQSELLPNNFEALEAEFLRRGTRYREACISIIGQYTVEHDSDRGLRLLRRAAADENNRLSAAAREELTEVTGEQSKGRMIVHRAPRG